MKKSIFYEILVSNKKYICIITFFMGISTFLGYAIPYFFKILVDNLTNFEIKDYFFILGLTIIISVVLYISSIIAEKYFVIFSENFTYNLQKKIIKKMYNSKPRIFNEYTINDFIRIVISDIYELKETLSSYIFQIINLTIRVFSLIFFLSKINIVISSILIMWYLFFYLYTKRFSNKVYISQIKERDEYSNIISRYKDIILGHIDSKFLFSIDEFLKSMDNVFNKYLKTSIKLNINQTGYRSLTTFSEFGTILILILYYLLTSKSNDSLTSIMTLFIYSGYIFPVIQQIFWLQNSKSRINGLLEPINNILKTEYEKSRYNKKISINKIDKIKLDNFGISLDNNKIIENFNFEFLKGNVYIIKGPSGCGKSTLLKSMLNLIDFSGKIYINEEDINNIDISSYYKRIIYIPQDIFIFNDTIINNIVFFNKNYDNSKINKIFKSLKLNKLQERLKENSGESGLEKISGGEKKRIGLARALFQINQKDIVILDETFSNLDEESKFYSLNEILKSSKDKILILTTHDKKLEEKIKEVRNISIINLGCFSRSDT